MNLFSLGSKRLCTVQFVIVMASCSRPLSGKQSALQAESLSIFMSKQLTPSPHYRPKTQREGSAEAKQEGVRAWTDRGSGSEGCWSYQKEVQVICRSNESSYSLFKLISEGFRWDQLRRVDR